MPEDKQLTADESQELLGAESDGPIQGPIDTSNVIDVAIDVMTKFPLETWMADAGCAAWNDLGLFINKARAAGVRTEYVGEDILIPYDNIARIRFHGLDDEPTERDLNETVTGP